MFSHGIVALNILWREKFEARIFLNHLVANIVPETCIQLTEREYLLIFFALPANNYLDYGFTRPR
jgi:hypothetical protein